jgi:hypothetical protein
MAESAPKADLQRFLQAGREALLWKLTGLSEYDIRRPMVPTGTNLLGLIKHVASIELGYFGDCFARPSNEPLPWTADDAEPNADMWATADESREQIVGLYHGAWAHSDATINALALDAVGHVAWWPADRNEVTLHTILVHVIAETNRNAGPADIIRSSTERPGCAKATPTCRQATRRGGRATGGGWSAWRTKPPRRFSDISVGSVGAATPGPRHKRPAGQASR